MENNTNNQISKQSEGFKKLSTLEEIQIANTGKLIGDCNSEEIKQALRYIFTLIGLRANLIPQDEAKEVLIFFIKKRLWQTKIDELRLSFEYAIEKRTEVELTLFGDTFSAKMVLEVVEAYKKYKISVVKSSRKEPGKTTFQIAEGVLSKMKPETLEYLKKIGKPEGKKELPREKTEQELIIQDIFREFDALHREKPYNANESIRTIPYNGQQLTQDKFLQIRLDEINKI